MTAGTWAPARARLVRSWERTVLGMRIGRVATLLGWMVLAVTVMAQQRDLLLMPETSRRLALVFGNDDYAHAPKLHNAVNDANDLARVLTELGFEVYRFTNADLRQMETGISAFVEKLRPGDVAFFHFSGHGIQIDGENYLIPIDFRLSDEASVKYDAYSASKLHDRLAGAGARLNIVVLDACRNNGFRRTRSVASGLAAMHAAEGSFIAFSTSPGETADDNPSGGNGLFTSYLLEALQQPGQDLDGVFNDVREKVYQASGKRQLPWSSSSVIGEFHFRREQPEPLPLSSAERSLEIELTYWNSIKDSENPALFEAYLTEHPEGSFRTLANIKLQELRGAASPSASTASTERPVPLPADTATADSPPVEHPVAAVEPEPKVNTASVRPIRRPEPSPPPLVEPANIPHPGAVAVDSARGLQYVWIPPGVFHMGCSVAGACDNDEMPRHEVTLTGGIWMMQTEVTVAAYERFSRATGRPMPLAPRFNADWRHPNHPVVGTTWEEAQAFCEEADGRLPTEAEWEYAARSGQSDSARLDVDAAAWHSTNSGRRTHEVGGKAPNGWGLFDMLGNASEWCWDWYAESYGAGPRTDPQGPDHGRARLVRGGSWQTAAKDLRLSDRRSLLPGMRNRDVGFRCVKRATSGAQ